MDVNTDFYVSYYSIANEGNNRDGEHHKSDSRIFITFISLVFGVLNRLSDKEYQKNNSSNNKSLFEYPEENDLKE